MSRSYTSSPPWCLHGIAGQLHSLLLLHGVFDSASRKILNVISAHHHLLPSENDGDSHLH
jgi:hypothetical protein